MASKIALWLLMKSVESLAKGSLTWENGDKIRSKIVDAAIKRADKAKQTKTKVDDSGLICFAGLLHSERLKAALEK